MSFLYVCVWLTELFILNCWSSHNSYGNFSILVDILKHNQEQWKEKVSKAKDIYTHYKIE